MENDIEQARASNMEEDKYIEMATNIVEKLDNEITSMTSKAGSNRKRISYCCIYRVPHALRDVNSKACTPALISIGPFHRGNKILAMGREKLRYFEKLTERNGMDKKKRCDIVISIKNQEDYLRYCYSGKFYEIKSNDFVEMILLDAVFIIEFFLESNDEKGPKSFKPRMTFDIREDLMLLENQLPLSIIDKIYDQVSYHSSDNKHKSFLDLATCYLREYLHLQVVETSPGVEVETSPGVKRSGHITDLLRNLMLCKTSPDVEKETSLGVKRSRHLTDLLRNLMLCKTSQGVEKETSSDVETEFSSDVETETSPGVKKETSPGVEVETSPGVKRSGHITDLLRNLMLCKTSPDVEKETSLGEKRSRHCTDLLRNLMLCKTSPGVEKETSSGVKKETSPDVKKEPRHLTDLLRNLMLSGAIKRSYSPDLVKLKYSAIMLRKAGVRFQVIRDECLVNITFDKGVLKIPQLEVDHNFERLVRNIMAMEQCLYERQAYICSYIKFMDHLIDSAGDVGLLVENGIILHWLGDDAAVSNMINNLCKNIGDNDTCFGDISKELNAHYENRCNHRKATLKLVYFPNIWRSTGTVAAAILLILTLLQTIKAFL